MALYHSFMRGEGGQSYERMRMDAGNADEIDIPQVFPIENFARIIFQVLPYFDSYCGRVHTRMEEENRATSKIFIVNSVLWGSDMYYKPVA